MASVPSIPPIPIPLLWISDAVSAHSGLARISRDICTRIHAEMPDIYRICSFGYGAPGSSRIPFAQYTAHTVDNWLLPELPEVVEDHFQGQPGIIMTCWDASRLGWLAHPETMCPIPALREWLMTTPLIREKWLYGPVDAEGINGKYPPQLAHVLKGFDRVLDYTEWSTGVTGSGEWLPHGIDSSRFAPMEKKLAKRQFAERGYVGLLETDFLVGIVVTNQPRKDLALGIETVSALVRRGVNAKVWIHSDTMKRHWDIPAMLIEFGLEGRMAITQAKFGDEEMAVFYSACDVTLGVGAGEGFGYPIFESLACATPVVTGNYAGAASLLRDEVWGVRLVEPQAWRYEGVYGFKRPVFSAEDWADAAIQASQEPARLPRELDWRELWPRWELWLRDGATRVREGVQDGE